MSHVDEAINEMFQATHMQMMRSCCRLEKVLLAAILLESRAKGSCCLAHQHAVDLTCLYSPNPSLPFIFWVMGTAELMPFVPTPLKSGSAVICLESCVLIATAPSSPSTPQLQS